MVVSKKVCFVILTFLMISKIQRFSQIEKSFSAFPLLLLCIYNYKLTFLCFVKESRECENMNQRQFYTKKASQYILLGARTGNISDFNIGANT